MSTVSTRVLAVLNVAALIGLGSLWVDEQGALKNMTWNAPVAIAPVVDVVNAPVSVVSDPATFAQTLERPIFAPDRKPPPPPATAPDEPPPDPLANVKLLGVISGETGGALLRADGRVRRIQLKQLLGDWTLQSIEERSATFTRGGETRVVKLEYTRLSDTPGLGEKQGGASYGSGGRAAISQAQQAQLLENANRMAEEQARVERDVAAMRARMAKKAQ